MFVVTVTEATCLLSATNKCIPVGLFMVVLRFWSNLTTPGLLLCSGGWWEIRTNLFSMITHQKRLTLRGCMPFFCVIHTAAGAPLSNQWASGIRREKNGDLKVSYDSYLRTSTVVLMTIIYDLCWIIIVVMRSIKENVIVCIVSFIIAWRAMWRFLVILREAKSNFERTQK